MKSTDAQIWASIIEQDWNLATVQAKFTDPHTFYLGRPLLYSAAQLFGERVLTPHGSNYLLHLDGHHQLISQAQVISVVDSITAQLHKILNPDSHEPVADYLREQFALYQSLPEKSHYGFYALYFDRHQQFIQAVQFPELPVFKLALVASCGSLYRDQDYQKSWYEIRHLLNQAHVLVAGASVASVTAHALLRDARVGHLTIGDPKGPNPTNFNRTTYDLEDVASGESKAICFARQVHAQDPTQIVYLEPNGFCKENFASYLSASTDSAMPRPAVDLVIEAVDNILQKIDILYAAQQLGFPIIQLADIGSKSILSFNNPLDCQQHQSLLLGVSDRKLAEILQKDFLSAAACFVGVENAIEDEIGLFLKTKANTPFTQTGPQIGSTAMVAAGLATEQAVRYLLDPQRRDFAYRRLIVDKKRYSFRKQHSPSLKGQLLTLAAELLKNQK